LWRTSEMQHRYYHLARLLETPTANSPSALAIWKQPDFSPAGRRTAGGDLRSWRLVCRDHRIRTRNALRLANDPPDALNYMGHARLSAPSRNTRVEQHRASPAGFLGPIGAGQFLLRYWRLVRRLGRRSGARSIPWRTPSEIEPADLTHRGFSRALAAPSRCRPRSAGSATDHFGTPGVLDPSNGPICAAGRKRLILPTFLAPTPP
jgi:hypothetical protein